MPVCFEWNFNNYIYISVQPLLLFSKIFPSPLTKQFVLLIEQLFFAASIPDNSSCYPEFVQETLCGWSHTSLFHVCLHHSAYPHVFMVLSGDWFLWAAGKKQPAHPHPCSKKATENPASCLWLWQRLLPKSCLFAYKAKTILPVARAHADTSLYSVS